MSIGHDLIQIKDDLHGKWFDLQRTKRSNHDQAFLIKPLYEEIIALGYQALGALKEARPDSLWIDQIETALLSVEHKAWVSDEAMIGPKVYYIMRPDRAKEAITQDINRLANYIHRAGANLIDRTGNYCGCDIVGEDLRSLNGGVLSYCQGTLKLGERRGTIMPPGDTVEHRPGAAETHANKVMIEPTEKGYDIQMEYIESGDSEWELRQDGIELFIASKGGKCTTEELTSRCTIQDASEDDIREIALVVSQMKDIDLLPGSCIDVAFKEVHKQKRDLEAIEPKEAIWSAPWTRARDMGMVEDCVGDISEGDYDEDEERERRDRLAQRLEYEISQANQTCLHFIQDSKKKPCVLGTYHSLHAAHAYPEYMRELCNDMKKRTDEPWEWCADLPHLRDDDIEEAAKDLVERCPPVPIMLALEPFMGTAPKDCYFWNDIEMMRTICEIAGDSQCLDEFERMQKRFGAGVKPGVFLYPASTEIYQEA